MTTIWQEIATCLYDGRHLEVAALVGRALEAGHVASDVLQHGLIAGMERVGQEFKAGQLFVPEVLLAARAMQAGMDVLRPRLAGGATNGAGKCVLGTVQGDVHDIGKNLVRIMLEGAGFETIDLGVDVRTEAFVEAVRAQRPQIVGLSALLTTTMLEMRSVIDALSRAGLRDSVRVLVGGAPLTAAFAAQIGADAYAPDAATAVDVARRLIAG